MNAQRERPERDSILAWNEAMKDVFARCSKKMAFQVCTVIIVLHRHRGGRMENINAWYLNTHMVYL
jgi:hypothetical protein